MWHTHEREVQVLAVLGVSALVGLVVMAFAVRPSTTPSAPTQRVDAHMAFEMVRREHPEFLSAATEETERLGPFRDGFVLSVMESAASGQNATYYGTPQSLAIAVERARSEGRLMVAGFLQRVLERVVGRA